jgi:hypothetical protein
MSSSALTPLPTTLLGDAGQELQVIVPPTADSDLNSWASQDVDWHRRIDGPGVEAGEKLPVLGHH